MTNLGFSCISESTLKNIQGASLFVINYMVKNTETRFQFPVNLMSDDPYKSICGLPSYIDTSLVNTTILNVENRNTNDAASKHIIT